MKKRINIILLIIFTFVLTSCDCENQSLKVSDFHYEKANKHFRDSLYTKLINKDILPALALTPDSSNEQSWKGALWAMGLTGYSNDHVYTQLEHALDNYKNLSPAFRRSLLEAIITNYPNSFTDRISELLPIETNPKLFAMISYYLRINNYDHDVILSTLSRNFPAWQKEPILYMEGGYLSTSRQFHVKNKPPVINLLKECCAGEIVLFSFQRINRDFPGITMIRKADGTFLKNPDSSYFAIPHFARAASNMPGYLTNGNTPAGILSFTGFGKSDNIFIGPVPNLQLSLPFEADVNKYFHGKVAQAGWDISLYQRLLPDSWKGYFPVLEAYYAGKAGRTEIISHGTTIDPRYYKDKTYYPYTPSLGCLTALELWDDSGKLVYSDQIKLINALKSINAEKGFFILIEINDENSPVTEGEIIINYLLE